MNFGLPNGFVRFGTVAHLILVYLHEYGDAGSSALAEDLDLNRAETSANLGRLAKYEFIFPVGRSQSEEGVRSYTVFSLYQRKLTRSALKRKTGAERSRTYRARLREKNLYSLLSGTLRQTTRPSTLTTCAMGARTEDEPT